MTKRAAQAYLMTDVNRRWSGKAGSGSLFLHDVAMNERVVSADGLRYGRRGSGLRNAKWRNTLAIHEMRDTFERWQRYLEDFALGGGRFKKIWKGKRWILITWCSSIGYVTLMATSDVNINKGFQGETANLKWKKIRVRRFLETLQISLVGTNWKCREHFQSFEVRQLISTSLEDLAGTSGGRGWMLETPRGLP